MAGDALEPTHQQATMEALHARLDQLEKELAELNRYRELFRRLGWVKLGLSATTAAMLGFWGPVLAVAAAVTGPLPQITWTMAVGWGCIGLARDIRSQLEMPPTAEVTKLRGTE